jgi:uncharacterized protein (DUF1684 family)
MFADGTSNRETYGAGRFLYVPLPVAGHVTVDFNRAYSPPCAFTAFAESARSRIGISDRRPGT